MNRLHHELDVEIGDRQALRGNASVKIGERLRARRDFSFDRIGEGGGRCGKFAGTRSVGPRNITVNPRRMGG